VLSAVGHGERTLKLIKLWVWHVAHNLRLGEVLEEALLILRKSYHFGAGLLGLKVGLTVEALRLNVADTLVQVRVNEDQVAWEVLVSLYFDEAAHFDLSSLTLGKSVLAECRIVSRAIVLFLITQVARAILNNVFDHTHAHHKQQRRKGNHRVRHRRKEQLEYNNKQEVAIGHLRELNEQVLGQECQHCILVRHHNIRLELITDYWRYS